MIARCATVDPTISAASELKDRNIALVLDRGHGDGEKLCRSFCILALLPCIRRVIQRGFSCQREAKVGDVPGNILFTATKDPNSDQIMRYRSKKNLTYDLIERRGKKPEDRVVYLEGSDHWTSWSQETHQKIDQFLIENGILGE